MSNKQKHPKDAELRQQIARTAKRRLAALIVFLVVILLVLLVARTSWQGWMSMHHAQIEGILALVIMLLIFLSPLIVEISSHPRTLSGPGKNPEGPRLE